MTALLHPHPSSEGMIEYSLPGATFSFDDGTVGTAARVEWGGVVEMTADEAFAAPDPDDDKGARTEAKEWLADLLAHGPVAALSGLLSVRLTPDVWDLVLGRNGLSRSEVPPFFRTD
jgi:hypothetical protein